MRVVLDTNEYVSALVFGGIPREILQRAERGDFELVVSAHIREEVKRVLCDKSGWSLERVAEAIDPLWEIAHFVTPLETISASRDDTDNRILECAVESGAGIIVSFDNDLLSLTPFKAIRIVKAREFVELLDGPGDGRSDHPHYRRQLPVAEPSAHTNGTNSRNQRIARGDQSSCRVSAGQPNHWPGPIDDARASDILYWTGIFTEGPAIQATVN